MSLLTLTHTYINIDDGWFILVKNKLSSEILAINLTRDQTINLYTFHSIHSRCFKYRIVRLSRSIQNPIWKYFSPARRQMNYTSNRIVLVYCAKESRIDSHE